MKLPENTVRLCESLFDITSVAIWLMNNKRIEIDDSRGLFNTCLGLAEKFEAENPNIGDVYMDRIESYAEEKLLEAYRR